MLRAFREARTHDRRTSSAATRAKRITCMHVQARLAAQCTHCAKRGITCRANAATASARHSICTRRHHAGKRFRRQGAHCTARSRHSLPKKPHLCCRVQGNANADRSPAHTGLAIRASRKHSPCLESHAKHVDDEYPEKPHRRPRNFKKLNVLRYLSANSTEAHSRCMLPNILTFCRILFVRQSPDRSRKASPLPKICPGKWPHHVALTGFPR